MMINDDENAVKTVSKCLARMKSCWGPEFEPSVEDIVDYRWYMAILSVRFLLASELSEGISPYSLAHGSGGHVRVNRLKPRAPIHTRTEHAQFVGVS